MNPTITDVKGDLETLIARLDKCQFFIPLKKDEAVAILPKAQKLIDENREGLKLAASEWSDFLSFEYLRRVAYKEGLHRLLSSYYIKSNTLIDKKISSWKGAVEDERSRKANIYEYRGHYDWVVKNVKNSFAKFIWAEAVKDVNEANLFDPVLKFYELSLVPLGFVCPNWISREGEFESAPAKFAVEVPLAANQVYSNIARGYACAGYDNCGELVRKPRYEIVKTVEKYGDMLSVLKRPEIIDSQCAATYYDGENELLHLRYWSEGDTVSRPLILEPGN